MRFKKDYLPAASSV